MGTIFEDPYQTQISNGSSFNEQHNYSRSASYSTTVIQKHLKEKDILILWAVIAIYRIKFWQKMKKI